MSGPTEIRELQSQIDHQIEVLGELVTYLGAYLAERSEEAEATREDGLIVAGVLENYYTAAETVLLRIVQQFGNQLDAERWHASLLDRLAMNVRDVRPRVLADATFARLDELRRFRHFKRYYYRIDYDWDKLAFLVKKTNQLQPLLVTDLKRFSEFLGQLA